VRTLVIDTATPACSVALINDGNVLGQAFENVGRGHAERLILMIASLPEGGRAETILIGCGPGSFTGVRIGIAAGRALGLAWDAPVRGFSTLSLVAASGFVAQPDAEHIDVAIDGGHGEVLVQAFTGKPIAAAGEVRSLPPKEAAAHCNAFYVVGNAAEKVIALRGFGTAHNLDPVAADAVYLSAALTNQSASPLYGREPDARPQAAA
jgi:tRNA threonylcarbamoyladenosine biosynthesis protein TsaB